MLAFYIGRFIPWASIDSAYFVLPLPYIPLTVSPQTIVAVSAIWLMSFVHLRGVGPGRSSSNILAALKVGAFLMFIVLGFSFGTGSTANLTQAVAPVAPSAWLFAFIPIMFTYSGWNAATYVAEEVRDPGKNVAKALAIGTLAVTAIYVFLNVLYIYVIPIDELAKVKGSVLDIVADRLLGTAAGNIMGVVSIIGLLAEHQRQHLRGAARLLRDGARRRVLSNAPRAIHPTYRTPANAIVAQANLGNAPGAVRWSQRAHDLYRIRRRAVRRRRGDHVVRAAQPRTERTTALHGARLPDCARRSSPSSAC